jgi:ATP synthase in type III secretion protein N
MIEGGEANADEPLPNALKEFERLRQALLQLRVVDVSGKVVRVVGPIVEAIVPNVRVGDACQIGPLPDRSVILAEVIGFNAHHTVLSPFGSTLGIGPGTTVTPFGKPAGLMVGDHLLGKVLDGFGIAMDESLVVAADAMNMPIRASGPSITDRTGIVTSLATGIRAIDGLLTLGKGQRMGVFAGPGCGKTTLMKAIALNAECDVVVIALIGERGRELSEIGQLVHLPGMLQKLVIVGATSDRSAGERIRAAYTATAIAEGFRERGRNVLLMVDSLTRFVRAIRETSIAAGEPLGRTGLPASVYAELPRLLERAGNTHRGSMSALYMVLAEGLVKDDPVADEVRSLVDGHIVLSRSLAEKGVYPAINVLESLSRTMSDIVTESHARAARRLRGLMARYEDIELLLKLGEIKEGIDAETDLAVAAHASIRAYLQQDLSVPVDVSQTIQAIESLADEFAG